MKERPVHQPDLPLVEAARPKLFGGNFLEALCLRRDQVADFGKYPFSIPAIQGLGELQLHPAVTFFVGENGSGKSTLLEAMALRFGFSPEGGSTGHAVSTRTTHSVLHDYVTLKRTPGRKPTDNWFLRAESHYNFATEVQLMEETYGHHSGGKIPYITYGGKSLHAQSHGESFFALMIHRLKGRGLYLFDEPEAALSPRRQLSLLTLLHRLVRQRSQFVIATHSPILLAYPHARIYEFGAHGIRETGHTDTEHYQVTRDFLNRHERMLEILLEEETDGKAAPNLQLPPRTRAARQSVLPLGKEARPTFTGGNFLQAVCLLRDRVQDARKYPFNLPATRALERLPLHPTVTFFIGENGSGKSTLLEAVALKLGLNAEGGNRNFNFATLATHSPLHEALRLERRGHFTDSWFLRAESFYNVASQVDDLGVTRGYGGKSLHTQSHGEAFLALLTHRLRGGGLYLFDEPEAALSPQRQLSLLTLLHRLVRQRSQLVIATHSPILLAYPRARIYEFGTHGIREIRYTDTDHYQVSRDFLNRHERMLELLLREEETE